MCVPRQVPPSRTAPRHPRPPPPAGEDHEPRGTRVGWRSPRRRFRPPASPMPPRRFKHRQRTAHPPPAGAGACHGRCRRRRARRTWSSTPSKSSGSGSASGALPRASKVCDRARQPRRRSRTVTRAGKGDAGGGSGRGGGGEDPSRAAEAWGGRGGEGARRKARCRTAP